MRIDDCSAILVATLVLMARPIMAVIPTKPEALRTAADALDCPCPVLAMVI